MSDVLDRPSALAGTAPEHPPAAPFGRIPIRGIVVAAVLGVLAWWLFVADTAADNDVIGGFEVLLTGLRELPALVVDADAYRSWWTWMSDAEGWAPIFERVVEHVQLVAMSMLFAIAISVVLGVLVHRVRSLRGLVLGLASITLTIPSLALFAIFISVPGIGIGDRGPIIALTMYSILPILRNTVIGRRRVDVRGCVDGSN